jgi:uncharacterized protein (DUF58 family)
MVDPAALMRIRNLELRAKVVVEGFWNGLHRSPYHGFSVEFTEYRPYSPGDDPRYLDWKLYARSDRFYIKKFEDETNLRCYLLMDHSRSMSFGSLGYTKSEYAATLAATLAYFLNLQGDAVGLLSFDQKVRDYIPARNRPGQLRQIMLTLEKATDGTSTSLEAPLESLLEIVRKRGMVVLISDLLAPLETLEKKLLALRWSGHEIVLFQVVDPAETTFNFEQGTLFQDLESGRELYIEPSAVRESYLRQWTEHRASVEKICRTLGIEFLPVSSDMPMEMALFDFLKSRWERSKKARRARL